MNRGCSSVAGLLCVWASALLPAPVVAQQRLAVPPSSLSHRVPATAELFIELDGLKQSEEQLQRAHLWSFVQLLFGEADPSQEPLLDWRPLVRRHLAMAPDVALDELFGRRMAIAAPSWERLANLVVLVRLTDPDAIRPVVATPRLRATRQRGRVRVYETRAGLYVATDGRHAAFSRDGSQGSLFDDVVRILDGGTQRRLSEEPGFAELVAGLSKGYMGYLCVGTPSEQTGLLARVLPAFREAVVGVYVRGERLDLEVRAQLRTPRQRAYRAIVDERRIERLPDTTLLAWAASLDMAEAFRALLDGDASGELASYLGLFRTALDLEEFGRRVVSRLGPRVILVWDRLRGGSDAAQFAVLFESSDAPSAAEGTAEAFASLGRVLRRSPPDEKAGPAIVRSSHLDTEILTVPLVQRVGDRRRRAPRSNLLLSLEPSFAALDGWLIATSTAAHARQLVEAYRGWMPALGSIAEMRVERWRFGEDAVFLAIAQPAMASAVVRSWQGGPDATSPSPLERVFGGRTYARRRHPRMGIGIRKDQQAGSAVVVRVDENQPASDRLQVGDRIVGADGRLLGLDDPVSDLRRQIAARSNTAGVTLRVRRRDEVLDVTIPFTSAAAPRPGAFSDGSTVALRQLEALGRSLSSAAYSVVDSPKDKFYARLSVRLVPPGPLPAGPQPPTGN